MRQTTTARARQAASARVRSGPTLSVVVVSDERHGGLSQGAARALAEASAPFGPPVLVVSSGGPDAVVRSILSLAGAEVIVAPAGCSRAEMCDLGMKQATGAIVSVRDGADVGDGSWLMAYRSVVPWSAAPATTAAHERATPETVVLDTMVAAAVAGRADPPARRAQRIGLERPARESGGLAATI